MEGSIERSRSEAEYTKTRLDASRTALRSRQGEIIHSGSEADEEANYGTTITSLLVTDSPAWRDQLESRLLVAFREEGDKKRSFDELEARGIRISETIDNLIECGVVVEEGETLSLNLE